MKSYLELMERVLKKGEKRKDRTGVGTLSLFGESLCFDLSENFPLLTTKEVHLKSIIYELLWFLRGDTNVEYLKRHGVRIWNKWADEKGSLGRVYGAQWRDWRNENKESLDQIASVISEMKKNPSSRRLLVVSFNPGELSQMALPPCHAFFQFYVSGKKELSCQMYQRSADLFLGVPFNIASYSLLTLMVAQVCGLKAKEFIHVFGDVHIYKNHLEQVTLQLKRKPKALPQIHLNPKVKDIFSFQYEDFHLANYQFHPSLKAEVAV